MTSKPETNFITRIHRKIDPTVYKQAMGLTSTNGTPDYYYEGSNEILWVEYKWYDKKPEKIDLCNTAAKPSLSRLQQHWLTRAGLHGVPVAVVAGYPNGCFLLEHMHWKEIWEKGELEFLERTENDWIQLLNDLNT